MKHYKCIFFDLDDTIWDFYTNAKLTLQILFEEMALSQYFDDFEQFFTIYIKRNIELWDLYSKGKIPRSELMLQRFNYPLKVMGVANSEKVAMSLSEKYVELLPQQTTLMPDAREVLEKLLPKYTLVIISNGFKEVQYKKMKNSNLEHYFSHIVLSETAGVLKPDKKIFDYALSLNKVFAHESIMVGDSFNADIVGAQRAGIDQVYYNQRFDLPHEGDEPTYRIQSLNELLDILK